MIRAVFFDVGEVLVNEMREYGTWADRANNDVTTATAAKIGQGLGLEPK